MMCICCCNAFACFQCMSYYFNLRNAVPSSNLHGRINYSVMILLFMRSFLKNRFNQLQSFAIVWHQRRDLHLTKDFCLELIALTILKMWNCQAKISSSIEQLWHSFSVRRLALEQKNATLNIARHAIFSDISYIRCRNRPSVSEKVAYFRRILASSVIKC